MKLLRFKSQKLKVKSFALCVLVLSFAFLVLSLSEARAQNQIFTAIPPRLEIKAKPGEFVREIIQFRNEGDTTAYLSIAPNDFIVTDTRGTPQFVPSLVSGRWSAASWIKLAPTSIAVSPKQTVDITLSANIPLDALPGGHYAGVLYQSAGSAPRAGAPNLGAGTGIQQVVGTLVYLIVEGPVTENALVSLFDVPKFLEFGPVNFTTEILNQSDLHITPKGVITVRNMLGKTTATLPLEERNIFPNASFVYDNTWEAKYLLGRYRADLSASYGSTGQVLQATAYFWVFPVKIALAILLAITIIILIIVLIIKKKREKNLEEEIEKLEEKVEEESKKAA
jgi:hypothetical protein